MEQKQRFSLRKNKVKLGLGVLTVLSASIAVNTVASSDALAAQGWVKSGNTWYFYNQNGTLAKNAWAGNYWLGADGKMVTNAWVDNNRYYVGNDGAWIKDYGRSGWQKEGNTWYYYKNGTLVRNAWAGNYWLGSDGRMATNSWVDSNRYYVGNDGAWIKDYGRSGWQKEGNTWYYYKNGTLVRNAWAGNYWLGADGRMATNSWVDSNRYYVGNDGAWIKDYGRSGWQKEGNTWYYYKNGTLVRNAWAGNYWLGSDGRMATNSWVDSNRYYVGNDGAWIKDYGRSGWQKEGNTWYYYKNGTLVRNAWAGNYWLGSDGRMATNSWVDSNRYYVGNDGAWIKDYGNKSGWQEEGSTWYYYKNGSAVRNMWIGNYWLGADGRMATSSWVDNGRYYVDGNGLWVPNYSKTSKNIPSLNMPQYYQGDARWGGKLYGIGTMAQSGCVPTALAMAFSGLGQNVLPTAVANTIYNNTNEMNVEELGTSGAGAVYAINAYGYKHTVLTTKEQLIAALQSGKPVFATVGNGIFARGSLTHAIILSGYSDGKTKAMDPDNAYTTGRWYDISTIWNQRSTDPYDTNIGGSFVAIG